MHIEEWSARRVAAVLASLRDEGISESRLARMAGVNRSQVNRWSRGENRPGYDAACRLAARLGQEHPDLAGEFLAAAGYGPPGPEPEPQPKIPKSLYDEVMNTDGLTSEERQAVIDAIERTLRGEQAPPTVHLRPEQRRRPASL